MIKNGPRAILWGYKGI